MSRLGFALLVAALSVSAGTMAMAQPPVPGGSQPFRKWDIGGTLAIRVGDTEDAVIPPGAWTADLGRYWTPNFKTSIGVMTARQTTYGGSGYTYDPRLLTSSLTENVTRPAGFAASATYQFLDNEFVHPYVSAGARFASTSTLTQVYSTRSPYGPLGSSTTPDRLEVRPVVGGGFKSYFGNGRAFMRSELMFSVGPHRTPHAILQIGAGVDF
jgi:hypothetical protein